MCVCGCIGGGGRGCLWEEGKGIKACVFVGGDSDKEVCVCVCVWGGGGRDDGVCVLVCVWGRDVDRGLVVVMLY